MEEAKQYIESGILELYVLGDLSPEERLEVERMAEKNPAVRKELLEISAAMELFAEENAVEPTTSLRNSILNSLDYTVEAKEFEKQPDISKDHQVIPLRPKRQTAFYKYAFAASVALLLVSLAALFNIYNSLQQSRQKLVALQLQNVSFANRVNFQENQLNNYKQRLGEPQTTNPATADTSGLNENGTNSGQLMALQQQNQQYSDKLTTQSKELTDIRDRLVALKSENSKHQKELNILSDPKSRFIKMKGMPFAPSASMLVVWNPDKKQLWISKQNADLPVNDKDHQYQLWAISKLKAINLGVFDIRNKDSIMKKMTSIDRATAFAVTLEPRGGSKKPTLTQMVVMGFSHK